MKVLIIGIHMDDCEYCAGGTAALLSQKGAEVVFLNITPYMHHVEDVPDRNTQSISSARVLGAEKIILDYEGTRYYKNNEKTVRRVEEVIRNIKPDIVFMMHPHDNHIEHVECSLTTREALFAAAVDGVVPNEIYTMEVGPMQNMCYFVPQLYIEFSSVEETVKKSLMSFSANHADGEWLWREKCRASKLRGHEIGLDVAEGFRILKFPSNGGDFLLRQTLSEHFRWTGTGMYYPDEGKIFF